MRQPDRALPVDASGLSAADAARRLLNEGPNELPAAKPKSNIAIALHVLSEPMFLLLLATVSLFLCVVVAVIHGLTRGSWLQGALAGLAMAISMVPEEFPVVLTVFLALGAWRISRKRVLTRHVPAIEMLGSATVLCVDKTGTLTMNRMSVVEVAEAPGREASEVLQAAMFASGENPVDPTERALHEAASRHEGGSSDSAALIREYPLSAGLLAMSRVVEIRDDAAWDVFAKGAPEAISQLCRIPGAGIASSAEAMAGRGLRVLGVARARIPKPRLPDSPLHIVFLELVIDPSCSVAFESEPEHPRIMNRPPRDPKARMFDRRMITSAVVQGLWLFLVTLAAFLISLYRGQGEMDARAISFATLVLGNLALIWANRSRTRTIPVMLRSRNTPLWAVTIGALLLLSSVLYIPSVRDLFQFSTLHVEDIAVCSVLAMLSVTWIEVVKLKYRQGLR